MRRATHCATIIRDPQENSIALLEKHVYTNSRMYYNIGDKI